MTRGGHAGRAVRARYRGGPTAFEYHAGWADRLTGETIPMDPGRLLDLTLLSRSGSWLRSSPGTIRLRISRWLSPLHWPPDAASLSSPPEAAPFAAIRFGRLCEEAGLPPGW